MAFWDASGAYAVYGAIAGGILAGGSGVWINHQNGIQAEKDRDSRNQEGEHERTARADEGGKVRGHEAQLERYRLEWAARERVYPIVVKVANRRMQAAIPAYNTLTDSDDPPPDPPVTPLTAGELADAASELEVVATEDTVEAFHKWLHASAEIYRSISKMVDSVLPPGPADVEQLRVDWRDCEQLTLGLMRQMRQDLRGS